MDIDHFFIEKGLGEALILLHGNGENCDYFQRQTDEFARFFHVYAIDTRGHGKTPRGNAPFTIRQFADDLLDFMDAHQIGKAHLLGFSDGGNIAMIFAMMHPDRVNFARISQTAKLNAEMLGLMVNDPNVLPEELVKIQAKTLVIAGTKDMIKDEHTRLIAQNIPDAQLVILEGNHFIANKCPQAFNNAVLKFLKG